MQLVRNFALGLALTLSVAGTAAAQRPAGLEQGKRSISFGLPGDGGSTTFGIWTMFADDLNLGLNLGLNLNSASTEGTTTNKTTFFSIAPALRYYTGALGPVSPFLYGETELSYGKAQQPNNGANTGFGLAGGLGAEWFPVGNISIAGFTGLGLNARWTSTTTGATTVKSSILSLGTRTSGLSINFYFGGHGTTVAAQR
jgi:hypothetical protein